MKNIEIMRSVLVKYELTSDINIEGRKRILKSKKRSFSRIMKEHRGEFFAGLAARISLWAKNNNWSLSFGGSMKTIYAAAGVCSIAAVVGLSVFLMNRAPEKDAAVAKKETVGANAVFVLGDVSIKKSSSEFTPLAQGGTVEVNDVIRTGKMASAVLQINKIGTVKILEDSEFHFTAITVNGDAELLISKGSVYSKVSKLEKERSYKVKTPTCIASVRGTQFMVSYNENSPTDVQVLDGKVAVASSESLEKELMADEQQAVRVNGTKLDKRSLNELEKLVLEKHSLYDFVDNLEGKSENEIKDILDKTKVKESELDEKIKKLSKKSEYINPLDRLRAQGKPLTMLHLRDGSQLAGSVAAANEKFLTFNTGEGVIKVPTAEILRRVMIK